MSSEAESTPLAPPVTVGRTDPMSSDVVRSAAALTADDHLLPTPDALRPLLPDAGLRRGGTVAVTGTGATSLAYALLAGPSAAGSWCAAVGFDSLGLLAAAELGIDLARTALVSEPGARWPTVVAALLDACDVVLTRPPDRAAASALRRLTARVRERERVLVWLDPEVTVPTPDVRLTATASVWEGPGWGFGHLTGRQLEIRADGRRLAGRPRRATVWLPDADGRLRSVGPAHDEASSGLRLRVVPTGRRRTA